MIDVDKLINDPTVVAAIIGAIFGFIGGFLSPLLQSYLSDRSFEKRLRFEDELARRKNLISQQLLFLQNLSETWSELASKTSKVTFYAITRQGFGGDEQERLFAEALSSLQNEGWGLFEKLRNEVRNSKYLVSDDVYKLLVSHYKDLEKLDAKVIHMASAEPIDMNIANKLHKEAHTEQKALIDKTVSTIAYRLRISQSSFAYKIDPS